LQRGDVFCRLADDDEKEASFEFFSWELQRSALEYLSGVTNPLTARRFTPGGFFFGRVMQEWLPRLRSPFCRRGPFLAAFLCRFLPIDVTQLKLLDWYARVSTHRGLNAMSKLFARFLSDESGATAIEYGLIAAGISLAIIAAVNGLGTNLNTKFGSISTSLK
jgi:pilus assembly protein Flp/PilA